MHAFDGMDALERVGIAAVQCVTWRPLGRQSDAGPDHGDGLQPPGSPSWQAELLLPQCEYLLMSLSRCSLCSNWRKKLLIEVVVSQCSKEIQSQSYLADHCCGVDTRGPMFPLRGLLGI